LGDGDERKGDRPWRFARPKPAKPPDCGGGVLLARGSVNGGFVLRGRAREGSESSLLCGLRRELGVLLFERSKARDKARTAEKRANVGET
jgi:hypothetical protein